MRCMRLTTYSQECVVDHILDHILDSDGVLLYQVQWLGYSLAENAREPLRHLSRLNFIQYHRQTWFLFPSTLNMAHAE